MLAHLEERLREKSVLRNCTTAQTVTLVLCSGATSLASGPNVSLAIDLEVLYESTQEMDCGHRLRPVLLTAWMKLAGVGLRVSNPRVVRMRLRRCKALKTRLKEYLEANGILHRVGMHIDQDLTGSDDGRAQAFSTVCRLIEGIERQAEKDLAELKTLEGALKRSAKS